LELHNHLELKNLIPADEMLAAVVIYARVKLLKTSSTPQGGSRGNTCKMYYVLELHANA